MRSILRSALATSLFLVAGVASCDAIVGAGDRKLDTTIECASSGGCTCAHGFGDCNGDPDDGCETDLDDPENCGACGNVCDNGECNDLSCACDEGFAECDADPTTICETDVASDAKHCGVCSRDCGSAACKDGFCQPEQLAGPGFVFNFVVVGSEIYYAPAMDTGIWHVPVDGGTPAPLDATAPNVLANMLVYDGGKVYWATDNAIFVTDVAAGMTTALASNVTPFLRIAVGGGKVYWMDVDPPTEIVSIKRTTTTSGGMVEKVATLLDVKFVNDFAVTPERVLWNDIDTIFYSPHDSIAATPFQTVPVPPAYFEPTPTTLLFSGAPGDLFEVPLTGGSTPKLADIEGYGWMTYDTEYVYATAFAYGVSTNTSLYRVSRSGSEPMLKLHESHGLLSYLPLSLDGEYIYWLDTDVGYIVRMRK